MGEGTTTLTFVRPIVQSVLREFNLCSTQASQAGTGAEPVLETTRNPAPKTTTSRLAWRSLSAGPYSTSSLTFTMCADVAEVSRPGITGKPGEAGDEERR